MCQTTIYLHSPKYRMRYNPEKIVTHGYKLHMDAWPPFMCNLIFVLEKDSKMKRILNHN